MSNYLEYINFQHSLTHTICPECQTDVLKSLISSEGVCLDCFYKELDKQADRAEMEKDKIGNNNPLPNTIEGRLSQIQPGE